MTKPFVLAIASVSGGGKTTAVRQLAQQLPNTKALYFDHYDFEGPEDILPWIENGADCNDWNLQPLLDDLEKLLLEPLDHIILDFPFADQHELAKQSIDYTIFIDTPLDLALARRLARDFTDASSDELLAEVRHYAEQGRVAYLHMLSTIKPNSDFVTDGSRSAEAVFQAIKERLHAERLRSNTGELS